MSRKPVKDAAPRRHACASIRDRFPDRTGDAAMGKVEIPLARGLRLIEAGPVRR
ncbi:MAG TPA: hypothetical protein VNL37_07285 [Candidatus Polarisedimenticolia bacterium]|nr:hypothetical protein [Candidatus Polarisedimenticolia bacterium]